MIFNKNKIILLSLATAALLTIGCVTNKQIPKNVIVNNIAQNPEGIEYDKTDNTFLLSSINAKPIIKIKPDGSFVPFTSGEQYPLSTAGLQIDYKHNRLLVAGFNGTELMDKNPSTKGMSSLRIYDLKTGTLKQDINLSFLAPQAQTYFANDIAVDNVGNVYISDWYAKVVYKVDMNGKATLFWKNDFSKVNGGANGLDFHPDGYLIVSLLNVNKKWLYDDYALVKIPLNNPKEVHYINIENSGFTGFDGMVIKENGNIVGVTNNQKSPGGNKLIELSSDSNWNDAKIINSKEITPSTTVAITPDNKSYVIQQDFSNNFKKKWNIKQIEF
ncbi:MAG: SMP-30/gluconolactonase/LRE family protein [Campylobacterota bacterium]|nr:SMP-30/gluconolactonase/LRE family protein [Campylobacterota bacterium]